MATEKGRAWLLSDSRETRNIEFYRTSLLAALLSETGCSGRQHRALRRVRYVVGGGISESGESMDYDDMDAITLRAQIEEKQRQLQVLALEAELAEKQSQLDGLLDISSPPGDRSGSPIGTRPSPGAKVAQADHGIVELIAGLRSPAQDELEDALLTLSEMVSTSFDLEGNRLGATMRAQGGLTQLILLLTDVTQPLDVQQQALLLLGNLCSDSVDSASAFSKRVLLHNGAERVIFSFLRSEDAYILMFACGLIQNLCHDVGWSERAMAHNVNDQLLSLLVHEDANVVKYAAGALKNMTMNTSLGVDEAAELKIQERGRAVARQKFNEERSRRIIAKGVRTIPSNRRLERMLTARGMVERLKRPGGRWNSPSRTEDYSAGPTQANIQDDRPTGADGIQPPAAAALAYGQMPPGQGQPKLSYNQQQDLENVLRNTTEDHAAPDQRVDASPSAAAMISTQGLEAGVTHRGHIDSGRLATGSGTISSSHSDLPSSDGDPAVEGEHVHIRKTTTELPSSSIAAASAVPAAALHDGAAQHAAGLAPNITPLVASDATSVGTNVYQAPSGASEGRVHLKFRTDKSIVAMRRQHDEHGLLLGLLRKVATACNADYKLLRFESLGGSADELAMAIDVCRPLPAGGEKEVSKASWSTYLQDLESLSIEKLSTSTGFTVIDKEVGAE